MARGVGSAAPRRADHRDDAGIVIAQVEDITDRKRAEAQLVRQAHFDALTALPNRSESMRRLRDAIAGRPPNGAMTAVFFCDLDRLKLVNDTHGHAVGDAYIREVSRRIRASVRDQDVVGRLSRRRVRRDRAGHRQPDGGDRAGRPHRRGGSRAAAARG